MILEIETIGEQTLQVTVLGTLQSQPETLHPGDRHPQSKLTYEYIYEVIEPSLKKRAVEVRKRIPISIKPFGDGPRLIEVGPQSTGAFRSWDMVEVGGRTVYGALTFEELRDLGPGDHFPVSHWELTISSRCSVAYVRRAGSSSSRQHATEERRVQKRTLFRSPPRG
jgi:hypothetical protein